MKESNTAIYNTVQIQAADGGWILKMKGRPDKVFWNWKVLVNEIELILTSAGDKSNCN